MLALVPGCPLDCVLDLFIIFSLFRLIGRPLFREHKLGPRKMFNHIFVSITSMEGIPLFRGSEHFFGFRSLFVMSILTTQNVTDPKD